MRVVTKRSTFCETAAAAPADTRVAVEIRARVADPFEAYCRAHRGGDDIPFETTGGRSGWGYFAPDVLVETGRTEDERRVVTGVRHRERPHVGVRFHPGSVLTDAGERTVASFCESCSIT